MPSEANLIVVAYNVAARKVLEMGSNDIWTISNLHLAGQRNFTQHLRTWVMAPQDALECLP